MSEVACNNCKGACCKGSPLLTLQLDRDELAFMKAGGNTLITVADPVDYDREEVIYPKAMQIDRNRQTRVWLAEPGREYEPLPAHYGRYALIGACQYLEKSMLGFELCGVYEDRPQVCRDFEMGSDACLELRILHEVPVPPPTRRPQA